ncbi:MULTISPECIES: hypothetical protein [Citrobacter]|nr:MULTISPECIES: hypothetical protein [Citrobacter]MCX9023127.1 hypothetical protein [Citrobacter portucalensis]
MALPYQAYETTDQFKACRPDKALTPHPATVVPDGAALISAYETTDQA